MGIDKCRSLCCSGLKNPVQPVAAVIWSVFVIGLLIAVPARAEPGQWTTAGAMLHPRGQLAVARLSATTVLVVGGPQEAEVFNLETETSSPAGALSKSAGSVSAVSLQDGRVLVLGAPYQDSPFAEVFDPGTGSFSVVTPPPLQGIPGPPVLLSDGRVLVAGALQVIDPAVSVKISDQAVLFEPQAQSWTMAATMNEPRGLAAALALSDGRAIVSGGRTSGDSEKLLSVTAEIYDPQSDVFSVLGSFQYYSNRGTLVDLGDGRVLAVNSGAAELLDVATGKTSLAYVYPEYRDTYGAVLLPGPRVLVYGGTSAEIFDGQSNTWESIASPNQWRDAAAGISGPGGKAYLFGGHYWSGAANEILASVEYLETGYGAAAGESCDQSLECLSGYCVAGVCCEEACVPDAPCLLAQCGQGTCSFVPVESGLECDDGELCTYLDRCDESGACAGTAYQCTPGVCHESSACNGDGTCTAVTVVEGTVCDDGDDCTTDGTCMGGTCVSQPRADCTESGADVSAADDVSGGLAPQGSSGCTVRTSDSAQPSGPVLWVLLTFLLVMVGCRLLKKWDYHST
jgi:hypothetical protein